MVLIGGADQGEILLIGDGEADAPVGVLKNIAAVMIIELVDHDVAALHHADLVGIAIAYHRAQDLADPWPAGIDEALGLDFALAAALHIFKGTRPAAADAPSNYAAAAVSYVGTALTTVSLIHLC